MKKFECHKLHASFELQSFVLVFDFVLRIADFLTVAVAPRMGLMPAPGRFDNRFDRLVLG